MRSKLSVLLAVLLAVSAASAATIATVPVSNSGNPADTRYNATGFGSVGYNYQIGTHEVTNSQYVEFLNSVDPTGANTRALYDSGMSSNALGGIIRNIGAANGSKYLIKPGRGNNPVTAISWYDSIRFANWLHNGQGSGDTENGAYTLLGGTPTPSNGSSIIRNAGAKWWLPSENEWYKAAYHKNDGVTGNYWDYPTSTNAIPYSDQPPGIDAPTPSNTANFRKDDNIANGYDDGYAVTGLPSPSNNAQNYLTDVGAYALSSSPYGTFDQGGNVWEWNETLISPGRGLRGSDWEIDPNGMLATFRYGSVEPTSNQIGIGFRVASIPEPCSTYLAVVASVGMLLRRRRECTRITRSSAAF